MIILISNIFGITKYKNIYFKLLSILSISLFIGIQLILNCINDTSLFSIYLSLFKILFLIQFIYFSFEKNIINYFNNLKDELTSKDNILFIISSLSTTLFFFLFSILFYKQSNILTLITDYLILSIYLTINIILFWILKKGNNMIIELSKNIDSDIKLEELTLDILTCKYNYEIMIYNIQNCFSLLVFIGLTNIYFVIKFIIENGCIYELFTPLLTSIILIINIIMIQNIIQNVIEIKHKIVHNCV